MAACVHMHVSPILFSGPMVRALLVGSKTQTRRILKPQPETDKAGFVRFGPGGWFAPHVISAALQCGGIKLPHAPGDLLYVRESWAPDSQDDPERALYKADGSEHRLPMGRHWKPSIHMPRWASRITIEVEAVKVERLQDISEEDAAAEGVEMGGMTFMHGYIDYCDKHRGAIAQRHYADPRKSYRSLWRLIHGRPSWAANPWVVATTFKVHLKNVDALLAERKAA